VANARRGSPGWLALVQPIQATAMIAAVIFLWASRPRRRDLVVFTLGTLGLAAGHRLWLRLFPFVGVSFGQSVLVGAGFASLLALGVRAATAASPDEREDDWAWFHLGAILPCFGMAMGLALDLTIPLHPRVFDPVVMALDGAFGQPSFLAGRLPAAYPAVLKLVGLVYLLLPVTMAIIVALERRSAQASPDVLRAILLAAVVGYALYQIYPVVGPEPLLGDRFPNGGPNPPGAGRFIFAPHLDEPRNCVPSLHVGWALLLYWHGRLLGDAARRGTLLWLALTAFATLATGQHYFVDLIVAVPFAALIDALAERAAPPEARPARARLVAVACALLLAWYAILLLAPARPPSAPPLIALAVVTVAGSWALHARWSAAAHARR
jgi:hypothetical protein